MASLCDDGVKVAEGEEQRFKLGLTGTLLQCFLIEMV